MSHTCLLMSAGSVDVTYHGKDPLINAFMVWMDSIRLSINAFMVWKDSIRLHCANGA